MMLLLLRMLLMLLMLLMHICGGFATRKRQKKTQLTAETLWIWKVRC